MVAVINIFYRRWWIGRKQFLYNSNLERCIKLENRIGLINLKIDIFIMII